MVAVPHGGARGAWRGPRTGGVVVAAGPDGGSGSGSGAGGLARAPAPYQSPIGEYLAYLLQNDPDLFDGAVEDQIEKLSDRVRELARKAAAEDSAAVEAAEGTDDASGSMTLYRRMGDVARSEVASAVQDLLYTVIVSEFAGAGIELVPAGLDGLVQLPPVDFKALVQGVHGEDAIALVREHLMVFAPQPPPGAGSGAVVFAKMSKLQMTQAYGASVMFGYFLRRMDRRFQLEKSIGTLKDMARGPAASGKGTSLYAETEDSSAADEVRARLEALFRDGASHLSEEDPDSAESTSASGGPEELREHMDLKAYIAKFDQQTIMEASRILSVEGLSVVQRHVSSVFGNVEELQRQIGEVCGGDKVQSIEEFQENFQMAVQSDSIETLTLTYGAQRRIILEGVAFGSFLRDAEERVEGAPEVLLQPTPPMQSPPPGQGGMGMLGPGQ